MLLTVVHAYNQNIKIHCKLIMQSVLDSKTIGKSQRAILLVNKSFGNHSFILIQSKERLIRVELVIDTGLQHNGIKEFFKRQLGQSEAKIEINSEVLTAGEVYNDSASKAFKVLERKATRNKDLDFEKFNELYSINNFLHKTWIVEESLALEMIDSIEKEKSQAVNLFHFGCYSTLAPNGCTRIFIATSATLLLSFLTQKVLKFIWQHSGCSRINVAALPYVQSYINLLQIHPSLSLAHKCTSTALKIMIVAVSLSSLEVVDYNPYNSYHNCNSWALTHLRAKDNSDGGPIINAQNLLLDRIVCLPKVHSR